MFPRVSHSGSLILKMCLTIFRRRRGKLTKVPCLRRTGMAEPMRLDAMIKINHEKLEAIRAAEVRAERDRLIAASDWAMMPDAPTDKEAWGAYRRALREVPQQEGFPEKTDWPVPPVTVSGE
ncbi:hypothetical protein AGJ02_14905 [Cronobacter sakazakii]|nr:hypothetical protein [Cronobacter sakazakii]EGZ6998712.1 hypothetical protein [Cronobacter sakazakii]EGZ7011623.1 hypothetical protein [Cronobacter sakazakii]EGZ7015440.1 hypothetical protein [Cronobacter sakazakii]EGZ7017952.1 hypothetical protein [Cronobacter sakazakii]